MMLQNKKVKIGCDIGSYSIKWLEGFQKNNTFKILSYFEVPIPYHTIVDGHIRDFAAIARGFKEIFKTTSRKNNVSIAIQGSRATLKKITTPIFKQQELPWCLQWEAEQYMPWFSEDSVIDSVQLNETQTLIAGSLKKSVHIYTQFMEDLDITLDRVETPPLSLEKVWKLNYPQDEKKTVALFSFGAQQSGLTLFQNQNFYGFRPIFIKGEDLTLSIQKKIKLNYSEAEHLKLGNLREAPAEVKEDIEQFLEQVAFESKKAMRFFLSQDPSLSLDEIYVTGGVSAMNQLRPALEEFLGAHIKMFNPFQNVIFGKNCNKDKMIKNSFQLPVALGLAM
ncbi:MAG: type IV pilus assembly protein PilM [Deltaproteobacteria bacterium]|nr:type IV pilus assembly protein PilM [Deltaproteobacteria bacterium]